MQKGKPKTVALVGMATTTRDQAPWDDKDIEIWTLNESPAKRFEFVKRVTRHFQLHPYWDFMREGNQNDPDHPKWLQEEHDFPIYMQEEFEDIPASVKYPFEEICKHFQLTDHTKYFTATFPYMMALALFEGFERIELYGFEMGSDTEYAYQKGSANFWIGMAIGAGVEVYLPDNCTLLGAKEQLYGYEMVLGVNPMALEIDMRRFKNDEDQLVGQVNVVNGKIQEKFKIWNQPNIGKGRKQKLAKEIDQLQGQMIDLVNKTNFVAGMRTYAELQQSRLDGRRQPQVARPQFGEPIKNEPK